MHKKHSSKSKKEVHHPMLHGHLHHQSRISRMDESLGERRGKESKKKQSMKSRRHESEGASHPKKFIQKAIKHPGALRRSLHVKKGEKIPSAKLKKAEHSKNPKTRKRAVLAETLKKLRKRKHK